MLSTMQGTTIVSVRVLSSILLSTWLLACVKHLLMSRSPEREDTSTKRWHFPPNAREGLTRLNWSQLFISSIFNHRQAYLTILRYDLHNSELSYMYVRFRRVSMHCTVYYVLSKYVLFCILPFLQISTKIFRNETADMNNNRNERNISTIFLYHIEIGPIVLY